MGAYRRLVFCVALVSLWSTAAVAADDLEKLVDLGAKLKLSPQDFAKQFVTEGEALFFVDGPTRRKLEKRPARDNGGRVKKHAEFSHSSARKRGLLGDDGPDDAPAQEDVIKVAVPKKVKAWADYFDPRGGKAKGPADKSVSHKGSMSSVSDQGSRGTCGAFSSMAGLEALVGGGKKLSAEYAYWLFQGKSDAKVCKDPGTYLDTAGDVFRKEGFPEDITWIYSGEACPKADAPALARDNAFIHAAHVYYVDRQSESGTKKSAAINDPRFLEAVLASGYNVVIGVGAAWGPDFADGEVVQDVIVDDKGRPHKADGGHAMLLMGYERTGDKKLGGGYFLLKNSWGTTNPSTLLPKKGEGYVKLSYDYIRQYADDGLILTGNGKVPDGGKCGEATQCANFKSAGAEGSTCCGGVCTALEKDWAGVFYCPNECVARAGASAGTCGKDGLADDGEACKVNPDCEGFDALGQEGSACCGGTCAPTQQDWAGVWYCADVCKGSATGKPGSCKAKADEGASCKQSSDCAGFNGAGKKGTGCCNGKCADLKKDWAGVYYCKADCVGAAGASKGTCPLKGKNKSCDSSADCASGRACCGGKCKAKLKDWAGVRYCPNECVGSFGGRPGTCD